MNMFCYQCEQTAKDSGCTAFGVCGKSPEVATLQDLLLYALKDISRYAHRAYEMGKRDKQIDIFTIKSLFSTLTNVNFDDKRFQDYITQAVHIKQSAKTLYAKALGEKGGTPETFDCAIEWWENTNDMNSLLAKGEQVIIQKRIDELGEDVAGMQELLIYGIKGIAAYADHAQILGREDTTVYAFIHKALDYLTCRPQIPMKF